MIVIILLIILVWLSLVAAGLVIGGMCLRRALGSPENRFRNIVWSVFGLALVAFLTFPLVLGPAVAFVACNSSVGLKLYEKVDLSGTGYELNWPTGMVRVESGEIHFIETPEGTLFRHGIDDVVSRRVAFIETASFEAGGLHRISLGPDSSPHCVKVQAELVQPLPLPAGSCLQIESVGERESRYVLETSPSFGQRDAFQRSVKFVARASGKVLASYTARRIPNAKFELEGEGARYCPADAPITEQFYTLPARMVNAD